MLHYTFFIHYVFEHAKPFIFYKYSYLRIFGEGVYTHSYATETQKVQSSIHYFDMMY